MKFRVIFSHFFIINYNYTIFYHLWPTPNIIYGHRLNLFDPQNTLVQTVPQSNKNLGQNDSGKIYYFCRDNYNFSETEHCFQNFIIATLFIIFSFWLNECIQEFKPVLSMTINHIWWLEKLVENGQKLKFGQKITQALNFDFILRGPSGKLGGN